MRGAPQLLDLRRREVGAEHVVLPHQIVGDGHHLAEDLIGRFGDSDVIAERLRHLLHAVEPFEQRHGQHDLRLQAVLAHEVAPDQQVEELIGAAHLHIALQRDGVVRLRQRIE